MKTDPRGSPYVPPMIRRAAVLATLALAGFIVAGMAGAEGPRLAGKVGPGFSISVSDASGARVTRLDAGAYELEVDDLSAEHNFHLTGPGVDVSTEVEEVGKKTFQLRLQDGTYRFICDPHATTMRGSFTVGAGGGETTTATTQTTPKPSAPVGSRLVLTSGPGFAITLKTTAGKAVRLLRPGAYTILVRDRSAAHNAHLLGAGVNRKTAVPGTAARTWRVVLRKGTLTFQCDPHRTSMRGTVKVA